MSIAKVTKNKLSGKAIDSVLKKKSGEVEPKIIGGNVLGITKQEIKKEFYFQEILNPKVKNTVTHILIAFPPGRDISDAVAAEYAYKIVAELGFEDNPFLVVRRFEKDNRKENKYAHIHIVASRINNDGSLIPDWKNAEKVIAAAKLIDERMDLKSVDYVKKEWKK